MRTLATLLSLLAPLPLAAQAICAGPQPSAVPSCMAGAWAGSSDMAEKMEAVLAAMPEDIRAEVGAATGRGLFIAIYEDGFFATGPLTGKVDLEFLSDSGSSRMQVGLLTAPNHGWMSFADGGAMNFCSNPGAGTAFVTMSGPDGTTTTPVAGAGGFVPRMTAACEGDAMTMRVELPAPIGTVTYSLRRLSPEDVPTEIDALYDSRLGG